MAPISHHLKSPLLYIATLSQSFLPFQRSPNKMKLLLKKSNSLNSSSEVLVHMDLTEKMFLANETPEWS